MGLLPGLSLAADALHWNDYVTLGLAVWGAGLSTFLGLRALRRDKRQLKVFARDDDDVNPETGEVLEALVVKVINEGFRPIQIDEIGIVVVKDDGEPQDVKAGVSGLPAKLEDGDGVAGWWLYEFLADDLYPFEKLEIKNAYARGVRDKPYLGKFHKPPWVKRQYRSLQRKRRNRAIRRKRQKQIAAEK